MPTFRLVAGFVVTALPFLLSKAGVSVDRIATVSAVALSPTFWAFLLTPIVDVGFSRRAAWPKPDTRMHSCVQPFTAGCRDLFGLSQVQNLRRSLSIGRARVWRVRGRRRRSCCRCRRHRSCCGSCPLQPVRVPQSDVQASCKGIGGELLGRGSARRRLPGRSRRAPIGGHNSAAPGRGLRGVGLE